MVCLKLNVVYDDAPYYVHVVVQILPMKLWNRDDYNKFDPLTQLASDLRLGASLLQPRAGRHLVSQVADWHRTAKVTFKRRNPCNGLFHIDVYNRSPKVTVFCTLKT